MRNRWLLGAGLGLVFLGGCNGSGSGSTSIVGLDRLVNLAALTASFPHDITATEAATIALRTLDPRYTIQNAVWFFAPTPSTTYRSDPLAHANIDYAHAAGLTGAGETIAILDNGFRTSHVEFNGKALSQPGGSHAPGVASHGTNVASIAAGSATGGLGGPDDVIGVAPGADLQLGTYVGASANERFGNMKAATDQARSIGAIVQNNSWGYDYSYSESNYNLVLGSTAGQDYVTSLRDLARDSVIVFAASNKVGDTTVELMPGLPIMHSDVEETWITVINAVPTVSGGRVTSADLISAQCLEAAAWCMAADGTWTAATGTGNADYDFVTGTSMAAPMVSGAVALLAEAFPGLSAKELRARLLASADNSFYEHTGYVRFAPGIRHGFDERYGHGFLDMKAALMPIGGSFMPQSKGRSVRVDQPIIQTGGMAGNALSQRLARHDIAIVDGLGAGFEMPASILTSEALISSGQDSALTLLTGLTEDPMRNAFPSYVSGQQLGIELGDTRIALLMPTNGSDGNYGFSVLQELGGNLPGLSLGLTAMREGESYVGMQSLISDSQIGGTHLAAVMGLDMPLSDRHQLRLTGTLGVARPDGDIPAMQMSGVNFNAVGVSYGINGLLAAGDRMTLGVNLPQVVHAGSAKVALPSPRSAGGDLQFDEFDISLTPQKRQMDLTFSYAVPMSERSEITFHAVRRLNEGHVAGQSDTAAGIGFRLAF